MVDSKDIAETSIGERKILSPTRVTTALIDAGYLRPEGIVISSTSENEIKESREDTIGKAHDTVDITRKTKDMKEKLHVGTERRIQPDETVDFDLHRASLYHSATSETQSNTFRVIYQPNITNPRDCYEVQIEQSTREALDKRWNGSSTVLTFGKSGKLREIYVDNNDKSGRISRNRDEKWEPTYPKLPVEVVEQMLKETIPNLDINTSKIDLPKTFANAFSTLKEGPSVKAPQDLLSLTQT